MISVMQSRHQMNDTDLLHLHYSVVKYWSILFNTIHLAKHLTKPYAFSNIPTLLIIILKYYLKYFKVISSFFSSFQGKEARTGDILTVDL